VKGGALMSQRDGGGGRCGCAGGGGGRGGRSPNTNSMKSGSARHKTISSQKLDFQELSRLEFLSCSPLAVSVVTWGEGQRRWRIVWAACAIEQWQGGELDWHGRQTEHGHSYCSEGSLRRRRLLLLLLLSYSLIRRHNRHFTVTVERGELRLHKEASVSRSVELVITLPARLCWGYIGHAHPY
jgi:hypothetical protein